MIFFSYAAASAMNTGAIVITSNIRDFQKAAESLGLQVATPTELVLKLGS
jgi:predicted nucleic acid-binding protein